MNPIDRFHLWRAERQVRAAMRRTQASATPADITEQIEARHLGRDIADEAARREIVSHCAVEQLGSRPWYDTSRGPEDSRYVQRALRYLDLRNRVIRHPVQKHLVRFVR